MAGPATPICRWRFSLLALIGVYPLITTLSYALEPLTAGWTTWQRCLLVAPIMVSAMVFGLIPAIHTHFGQFIRPGHTPQRTKIRNQR